MSRVCACGCKTVLDGRRRNARYATDACRTRAWKDRAGYRDPRKRKPSRNGGTAKKRKPDMRISYHRALVALVGELQHVGTPNAEKVARRALDPLLTDRQRKAL